MDAPIGDIWSVIRVASQPEPSDDIPDHLIEKIEEEPVSKLRAVSAFAKNNERQTAVPQYVRYAFAVEDDSVQEAIGEYAAEMAEYLDSEEDEMETEVHETESKPPDEATERDQSDSERSLNVDDDANYGAFYGLLGQGNQNWKLSLLLVLVFALLINGMTVITVTDRTALNEQYVNNTFAETGVHQEMTVAFEENLAEQLSNKSVNAEELANEAITEQFVTAELRRNINETVAYLQGDKDTLDLAVNYEPVRLSLLTMTDPETHDTINESVPPEVNIRLDAEDSGLATARVATTKFPLALVSLGFCVLVTVGVILYRTPDYRASAQHLGFGLLISSFLTLLLGTVLLIIGRELTISTIGEVRIDPEILFNGVLAVAERMGVTMLTYAGVLFFFGVGLLGLRYSMRTSDIFVESDRETLDKKTENKPKNVLEQTEMNEE